MAETRSMKKLIVVGVLVVLVGGAIYLANGTGKTKVNVGAINSLSTEPSVDTVTEPTVPPVTEPSAATVKSWPTKWCEAKVGMTLAELTEVMGEPVDMGYPESVSWSAFNYQFNAFFDVDGKVRQLDTNDILLSDAEKAAIPCDPTRK